MLLNASVEFMVVPRKRILTIQPWLESFIHLIILGMLWSEGKPNLAIIVFRRINLKQLLP